MKKLFTLIFAFLFISTIVYAEGDKSGKENESSLVKVSLLLDGDNPHNNFSGITPTLKLGYFSSNEFYDNDGEVVEFQDITRSEFYGKLGFYYALWKGKEVANTKWWWNIGGELTYVNRTIAYDDAQIDDVTGSGIRDYYLKGSASTDDLFQSGLGFKGYVGAQFDFASEPEPNELEISDRQHAFQFGFTLSKNFNENIFGIIGADYAYTFSRDEEVLNQTVSYDDGNHFNYYLGTGVDIGNNRDGKIQLGLTFNHLGRTERCVEDNNIEDSDSEIYGFIPYLGYKTHRFKARLSGGARNEYNMMQPWLALGGKFSDKPSVAVDFAVRYSF